MSSIIKVENLSKRYYIGRNVATEGLRHRLERALTKPFKRQTASGLATCDSLPATAEPSSEFWALRDVSFEVQQGEVVGIIGRNGAGKSTLLKVLSRITEPTNGRVTIDGRVASLLEVGTGFHPELTGRENIFLNGAILGMTKREIKAKFDEIVAFAEVEKFIDTPVKRYSSGMYVRLAFAVAAHLEPEILIVDEVLAVGDTEFQRKCASKMRAVASGGRTVLLVSHNMTAIQNICQSCLWLQSGSIVLSGKTDSVVSAYLSHGQESSGTLGQVLESSREFTIEKFEINGSKEATILAGQPCRLSLHYKCSDPSRFKAGVGVSFTFRLNDEKIVNLWSVYCPAAPLIPESSGCIECLLEKWPFRENTFEVDVYVHALDGGTLCWILRATKAHGRDGDFYSVGKVAPAGEGILFLDQSWAHYSTHAL